MVILSDILKIKDFEIRKNYLKERKELKRERKKAI